MTAKAAAVLTAVLPSALVKAANMEPVMFMSTASADWDVAAITLRISASAPSSGRTADAYPRSRDDFGWIVVLDAVTLDRDHFHDLRERAEGLRRGPVEDHTINRGMGGWGRCHGAWREGSGYSMCPPRTALISQVRAVTLAARSGGSSAREHFTKPLLVPSQYRAARVILK